MRYLSVCSGIEAASVAWHPLGWEPVAFSEIDAFPSAVLAAHYPNTPNLGDMTKFQEWPDLGPVDVLVGGTPCQSFSVAGLRRGLADPRGNLMLTFGAIARRYRPRWLLWENVPGVLSSDEGRDFGTFLGMLGELGYGYAYRILDAQYFGLAQRRKRVFVVGHFGDWRPAAAVFLERAGLRGDSAPSREARKDLAPTIASRTRGGGGLGTDAECDGALIAAFGGNDTTGPRDVSTALTALTAKGGAGRMDFESETFIAFDTTQITSAANRSNPQPGDACHPLSAEGHAPAVAFQTRGSNISVGDISGTLGSNADRASGGAPMAFAIQERAVSENADAGPDGAGFREGVAYTLEARQVPQAVAHAFDARQSDVIQYGDQTGPLDTDGHSVAVAFTLHGSDKTVSTTSPTDLAGSIRTKPPGAVENSSTTIAMQRSAVRRLTPRECERLQGFPDDYLDIIYRGRPAADGPKYKALGNSMAVPCMRWIGERIERVERVAKEMADGPHS